MKSSTCWILVVAVTACGGSTGGGGAAADAGVDAGGSGGSVGGSGGFAATGGTAGAGALGGAAGVGGSSGPGAQPPAPDPNAPPASATTPTTLAVDLLLLGETDPTGNLDATAWKQYGFDVDGQISTASSTFHCKPKPGVPASKVQVDGNDGIDNSWGRNLVPIIENLSSAPSQAVTASIQAGDFSLLFHFMNLDPIPSQNGVVTRTYAGAPIPPPSWLGSDVWPVTAESVNGTIDQPKSSFPAAYVVNGQWVSGAKSAVPLSIPLLMQGFVWPLVIHEARVSMTLSGSGTSAQGDAGIISGVLVTSEVVSALKSVAGSFDPGLCDGPTFDSIAQQIEAASDILADGTQDPTKECDAISIGIGFRAKAVKLGAVAPPVTPTPDPCAN